MAAEKRQPGAVEGGGRARGRPLLAVALFWAALVTALLVVLLLVAPFLLVRIAPVREAMLDFAAGQAGLAPGMRLRIEEVGSLNPARLRLEGVSLERRGAGGEWRPLVEVGTLAVGIDLDALLKRRLHLRAVAADSVLIHLADLREPDAEPDAEPRGGVPQIPALSGVARAIGLVPPLSLGALDITRVAVVDSAGLLIEGGLQLANLRSEPRGLSGDVRGGELRLPRLDLGLRLRQGSLLAARDGLLEVRGLHLEMGESRATLQARHDPSEKELPFSGRLTLQRLVPQPLAERYAPELVWEPGDSLSGDVEAQLGEGRLRGSVLLAGRLRGEALDELAGRLEATGPRLVLSDFHLVGDPGEVHGRGHWDLELSRGEVGLSWRDVSLQSAWLPWLRDLALSSPLSGSATADVDWPRGARPRIVGEAQLLGADPWGIPVRSLRAVGRADLAERFVAGDVEVLLGAGGIHAFGEWPLDGRPVAVTAQIDSVELRQLPAAWIGEAFGRVTAGVELEGRPSALLVRGELEGRALGWREWRADSLDLREAWVGLGDLAGGGRLSVAGLRRGDGEPFSIEASAARAGDEVSGEFLVTHPLGELSGAGAVDPARSLTLTRIRLDSDRFGAWDLAAPFHARWAGERIETDSLRIVGDRGQLAAAILWQGRGEAFDAGVSLQGFDLGILGAWLQASDSLRGLCDLKVVARGYLPDPELTAGLSIAGFGYGPFEPGELRLDAGWAERTLSLEGTVGAGARPPIRVSGVSLETGRPLAAWIGLERGSAGALPLSGLADCPLHGSVEIDSLALSVLAPLLGTIGETAGHGASSGSSLFVGGESVPIETVTPWDPEEERAAPGVGGSLHGRVTLEGTPRRPQVRVDAHADGLRFARIELGRLSLAATYADSLVRLGDARLERAGRTSWARGYYPLAFSIAPLAARPLDRAAAVQIEVDSLGLAFVSRLTRHVPDATGALSGQATLGGSGLHPELRGNLTLTGGGLRIPQRSERIYDVRATLVLVPGGVEVRSLDARTGPRGTVSGVGSFMLPDQFDFTAVVQQARIWEEGQYDFVANASLNAFSSGTGRAFVPRLNGAVEVLTGTITQNLAEKESPPASGEEVPWVIDLDVDVPGSIHVSQINAKAEVGEGRLQLAFRWPYWNASGSLRVLGGTYRLLNNTFTVTDGTVDFRDSGQGPDLTLAVEAETSVAVAGEEDGPSETVTVTVSVNGKPEALEVGLSSQPPLSEEEIVELLSYGRFTRSGRFEAASETQWILLNTMVDRIETSLIAQSTLFTRVGIAPGSSGDEPLRLTWRPVVTPSFQVNYAQELALDPEMDLSVNYRLSRVLYLRAGIARDRQTAGSFDDEYSLDLKCRFEYE